MKLSNGFIACLLILLTISVPCSAQVEVWNQVIQQVNVNLRGSAVVLGQQTIEVSEAGNVLVQFDGNCVSSAGDRILLAASNTTSWAVNDGHTAVEAYDGDVNRHSFSHSRMYPVAAGSYTFSAVGQNFVETDGTGIASVYANLTVKFFPHATSNAIVRHTGVIEVNRDLTAGVEVIAQQSILAGSTGSVMVRFDGMCVSDPGDLIVIAASNTTSWSTNDGNTGTEAIDNDLNTRVFCHSRKYDIGPGFHTFYGVAQNFVETAGDGHASFYGSLTVEFFPTGVNAPFVSHVGVSRTNVDVEGAPVTMGELSISPAVSGKAVVRYEGLCASSAGDRIVMAASNIEDWSSNSGNVNVEAISADLNYNNFSHTRVYDVAPGSQTFYAVCENFVETAGTGIASNYASLSVEFFPDPGASPVGDDLLPATLVLEPNYPNPFNPTTSIAYELREGGFVNLSVYNLLGQNIRTLVSDVQSPGRRVRQWDGKDDHGEKVASGVYMYRLTSAEQQITRKMILMK